MILILLMVSGPLERVKRKKGWGDRGQKKNREICKMNEWMLGAGCV